MTNFLSCENRTFFQAALLKLSCICVVAEAAVETTAHIYLYLCCLRDAKPSMEAVQCFIVLNLPEHVVVISSSFYFETLQFMYVINLSKTFLKFISLEVKRIHYDLEFEHLTIKSNVV